MAKYPKKPKLSSLPKRPKATASLSVLENYKKRVDEVRKNNAQKQKDWGVAKKKIDTDQKRKEKILKETQGLGRI